METLLDIAAGVLWVLMFLTPFLVVPFAWKFIEGPRIVRVIIGLILSAVCVCFLYCVSLSIIFRHGMGPG